VSDDEIGPDGQTTLVGRERELEAIATAMAPARRGAARVGHLVREPGIGKTALAEHAAALASGQGWAVAWGPGTAPPYWIWQQILGDQPAMKVLEAVVAAASVDEHGRAPKGVAKRLGQQLVQPLLEGHDLAGWQLPEQRHQVGGQLLEAHAAVLEVLKVELQRECDLPLPWYDVLLHLSEAPDRRLRMQELASRLVITQGGVTRLVHRMQAAGLVMRVLTDQGHDVLREAARVHLRGVEEHFLGHLTPQEVEVLRVAMDRVLQANSEEQRAECQRMA
jgi:DNA-binding MarR family transcriptional regulator